MHVDTIAITGRFQPFHLDHLELVMYGLSKGKHVFIGITNPDIGSLKAIPSSAHRHRPGANPFTYLERLRIISAALKTADVSDGLYEIVPFPLDDPRVWADYIPQSALQLVRTYSNWERDKSARLQAGGYEVEVLQGDPGRKISASDVRAAMAAGQPWQHWLPQGAAATLEAIGCDVLQRRCAFENRPA